MELEPLQLPLDDWWSSLWSTWPPRTPVVDAEWMGLLKVSELDEISQLPMSALRGRRERPLSIQPCSGLPPPPQPRPRSPERCILFRLPSCKGSGAAWSSVLSSSSFMIIIIIRGLGPPGRKSSAS